MGTEAIFYGADSPNAGQIKEIIVTPDQPPSPHEILARGNDDRVSSIKARARKMIKNGDATGALALLSTIGA